MRVLTPALFLLGETLFRVRMIGSANGKRVATIVVLALLWPLAGSVSALVLTAIVAAVLTALALWEYEPLQVGRRPRAATG